MPAFSPATRGLAQGRHGGLHGTWRMKSSVKQQWGCPRARHPGPFRSTSRCPLGHTGPARHPSRRGSIKTDGTRGSSSRQTSPQGKPRHHHQNPRAFGGEAEREEAGAGGGYAGHVQRGQRAAPRRQRRAKRGTRLPFPRAVKI